MSPSLEPLELVLEPSGGPLLPQVREALAERIGGDGEALRWAITAVEPSPQGRPRLSIEAVVWRPVP